MADIQEAIWSFTPSGPIPSGFSPPSAIALALENAATTYLAGHGGVFVPAAGQIGIVIYYINDTTQLLIEPYNMGIDNMGIGTGATVSGGGGGLPFIKASWVQEPDNNITLADGHTIKNVVNNMESGDPTHQVAGTQINPR